VTAREIAFVHGFCLIVSSALAKNEDYDPFTSGELKAIEETKKIEKSAASKVECQVTWKNSATVLQIYVEGKRVYEDDQSHWFRYGDPVVLDLDGNGLDDVIKNHYPGSQGLGLGCHLYIYSQYEAGRFVKLQLPAERFTNDDIFDLNKDQRKEFVTCVLVKHEKHNYWVYRCWQLKGRQVISVDDEFNFPRAIWFTAKPNKRLVSPEKLKGIMENYPKLDLSREKEEAEQRHAPDEATDTAPAEQGPRQALR